MDSHSSGDNFLFSAGWDSLVALQIGHDQISVEFDPQYVLTLNIGSRKSVAIHRIRALLKRSGGIIADNKECLVAHFSNFSERDGKTLKHEIMLLIDEIASAPLTPKMVRESLGVTAKKVAELTQLGQIKSSGQGEFVSNNSSGHYKLYSASSIRRYLLDNRKCI
jgi:hypothetical protein